ncbi:TonB-dependent receptor plug domain-containing protein [Xenorhabdus sp. PR6a]|uniref:TonB-dependent receptor plug domain-containing protein n=1 Tax=Xenorhabdus sp. PR6a TaxID=3025877 RepID=UPI003FD53BD7
MVLPGKNETLKIEKIIIRNNNNNKLFLTLTSALLLSPYASAANNTEDTVIVTGGLKEHAEKNFVESDSTAGTKSLTPLIKTPQSISVINRTQIEAQGAMTVADALNYSSGVVTNYRGSSNRNDEVITRGFRYAPKFLDGLSYGSNSSAGTVGQIDPWLLECVELVHGPASVLYGQVSPGGLINMTSKRPTAQTIRKV